MTILRRLLLVVVVITYSSVTDAAEQDPFAKCQDQVKYGAPKYINLQHEIASYYDEVINDYLDALLIEDDEEVQ